MWKLVQPTVVELHAIVVKVHAVRQLGVSRKGIEVDLEHRQVLECVVRKRERRRKGGRCRGVEWG